MAGFNFGGMMQGMGAGMVQTGAWMKEQEKLDWETQQATLKYERDMHMEKLRLQAAKEGQERGIASSEKISGNQIASTERVAGEGRTLEREKLDVTRAANESQAAYQNRMAGAAESNAATSANESAAKLEMLREAKDAPEKERATRQAWIDENYEPGSTQHTSASAANMGVAVATPEKVPADVQTKVLEMSGTNLEELKALNKGKDYKKAWDKYRVLHKGDTELDFQAAYVANYADKLYSSMGYGGSDKTKAKEAAPATKGELPDTQIATYAKTLNTLSATDRAKAIDDMEKKGVSKMSIYKITSMADQLDPRKKSMLDTPEGVTPISGGGMMRRTY